MMDMAFRHANSNDTLNYDMMYGIKTSVVDGMQLLSFLIGTKLFIGTKERFYPNWGYMAFEDKKAYLNPLVVLAKQPHWMDVNRYLAIYILFCIFLLPSHNPQI